MVGRSGSISRDTLGLDELLMPRPHLLVKAAGSKPASSDHAALTGIKGQDPHALLSISLGASLNSVLPTAFAALGLAA